MPTSSVFFTEINKSPGCYCWLVAFEDSPLRSCSLFRLIATSLIVDPLTWKPVIFSFSCVETHKLYLVIVCGNQKHILNLYARSKGHLPFKMRHKSSKRYSKNEVFPSFQQPERSNSDSLKDYSASGNEYRALRRKYLLLEEESFVLEKELREVEDEVKTLEDEKVALLHQLVVLEGLIDPSESSSVPQK
ncbi:hypothetical protein JRO89_XS06G0258300 [Xanthoceras sorbifolium]|uniref:Uncharacterized protein n=1 Tax=Xanthoceras sorbifolium TaxID=99658 RepID=A0ABQ8HZK1_9ROSI|nr:hypothetical protein JRO89_XS06G0258300 [Xanthoceras sorbifolium]